MKEARTGTWIDGGGRCSFGGCGGGNALRIRADVLVSCGVLNGKTVPSARRGEPRERDTDDVTAMTVVASAMGW